MSFQAFATPQVHCTMQSIISNQLIIGNHLFHNILAVIEVNKKYNPWSSNHRSFNKKQNPRSSNHLCVVLRRSPGYSVCIVCYTTHSVKPQSHCTMSFQAVAAPQMHCTMLSIIKHWRWLSTAWCFRWTSLDKPQYLLFPCFLLALHGPFAARRITQQHNQT